MSVNNNNKNKRKQDEMSPAPSNMPTNKQTKTTPGIKWDANPPPPTPSLLVKAANDVSPLLTPHSNYILMNIDSSRPTTVSTSTAPAARKSLDPLYKSTATAPASASTQMSETRGSTQHTNSDTSNIEPAWVQTLIDKMDSIDSKIGRISDRVDLLETEMRAVHALNQRVSEIEESVQFMSNRYEAIRSELEQSHKDTKYLTNLAKAQSEQLQQQALFVSETATRMTDLENRSMRDNLIFTGIPEERNENPEVTVQKLISDKLGFRNNISFERVHRIGKFSNLGRNSRPRAIVAKFSRFKDREMVRNNANKLKGTPIGIQEQFGKEVNDKRRKLFPKFKQARDNKQYARLVYDYLIIDNTKFKVDENGEIFKDTTYNRDPPQPPRRNHHETTQATENQLLPDDAQYNNGTQDVPKPSQNMNCFDTSSHAMKR